jgi:hypothetical protein
MSTGIGAAGSALLPPGAQGGVNVDGTPMPDTCVAQGVQALATVLSVCALRRRALP